MMIMIMKTPGSQVDFPVAERNRREGGGKSLGKFVYYDDDQPRRVFQVRRPYPPLAHVFLLVSFVYA